MFMHNPGKKGGGERKRCEVNLRERCDPCVVPLRETKVGVAEAPGKKGVMAT